MSGTLYKCAYNLFEPDYNRHGRKNFVHLFYSSVVVLIFLCALCQAQRPTEPNLAHLLKPPSTDQGRQKYIRSGVDATGKLQTILRAPTEQLFSPSIGRSFYEIAYEIANNDQLSGRQIEQALILLTAVTELDPRANYVLPDIIKLAARDTESDRSELVLASLVNYTDENTDIEAAREAVQYLLEQQNSREEREQLLQELHRRIGSKNAQLDSELATMLGLLASEKTDSNSAIRYFMMAYDKNKYNKLAFARLTQLIPEQIDATMYLENLRLTVGANPLDLDAATAFAEYARRLELYEIATDAYQYCADLFGYLYPSEPLPAQIYLPWALSSYNTLRSKHKTLEIAERVREAGQFDLLLEAIAGKSAENIGDVTQAKRILQAAEYTATFLLTGRRPPTEAKTVTFEQLAWFYCFAMPDADKALDWANKAYSSEPNLATAAAVLAYALVVNSQADWAKPIIENYERTQISDLAMARIHITNDQNEPAIEALKSAISKDPATLEAEYARELLRQLGSEYIPAVDADIFVATLRNSFRHTLVPSFVRPENIISVQLNLRGSKFSYGSDFGASVVITNNYTEPIVISEDGLFTGRIRLDADITGDISKKIPELVSVEIQPSRPIEPGQSSFIPVRLVTGELRNILLTYPQASLDIEFTVYIDPVTTQAGPANRLASIEPVKAAIKRPGIELSAKYLQNRINTISTGRHGQKIKAAQLFAGLLREHYTIGNQRPYKLMHADWMPVMLKSALAHNLSDDNWIIKTNTMAAMLLLPLDYELINATSENLNDTNWPARLLATFLLARNQGTDFKKVLDWVARYDSNHFVREMAVALGAVKPVRQIKEPQEESEQRSQQKPTAEHRMGD